MAKVMLRQGVVDERRYQQLVEGLAAELERPDDSPRPNEAPTIYYEELEAELGVHYFAAWSRFENVDGEVSGRALREAIRQVYGEAELRKVTIAMGLTPAEAKQMGLYLD